MKMNYFKRIFRILAVSFIGFLSSSHTFAAEKIDMMEQKLFAGQMREVGFFKSVEDGAYPMFSVTIELSNPKTIKSYNLNIENTSLEPQDLDKLVGTFAPFIFTSNSELVLMEIDHQGRKLFGDMPIENSWGSINGTLRNAGAVTQSDLPSKINIETADGKQFTFDYFIPEEMVALNNKQVTLYHSIFINDSIIDIQTP